MVMVVGMADEFLRTREGGTDRTYAYLLVDQLAVEFEGLTAESVTMRGSAAGPGRRVRWPLRAAVARGKSPYRQSSLDAASPSRAHHAPVGRRARRPGSGSG